MRIRINDQKKVSGSYTLVKKSNQSISKKAQYAAKLKEKLSIISGIIALIDDKDNLSYESFVNKLLGLITISEEPEVDEETFMKIVGAKYHKRYIRIDEIYYFINYATQNGTIQPELYSVKVLRSENVILPFSQYSLDALKELIDDKNIVLLSHHFHGNVSLEQLPRFKEKVCPESCSNFLRTLPVENLSSANISQFEDFLVAAFLADDNFISTLYEAADKRLDALRAELQFPWRCKTNDTLLLINEIDDLKARIASKHIPTYKF